MSTEQELCDQRFYKCNCDLEKGHEGPHVCACEGSWSGNPGEEEVVSLPNIAWNW